MTTRAQELLDRLVRGGEAALDELIADRASEELFLDFKGSPDNGSGTKLHYSDREKLAKAISGFGNSEGGVLVWGIDCENLPAEGDVARSKRPLKNPARFKSWLEGAVSGCTLPPHQGVEHRVIPSANSADEGFLVTLIPKSLRSPHQCIVEPHRHRYYMRVGSNFDHVPHGLLAGMFGQQPQPHIFHIWKNYGGGISGRDPGISYSGSRLEETPYSKLGFVLRNEGACVARDLYVNIEIGLPGQECALAAYPTLYRGGYAPWTHTSPFKNVHQVVSGDGYKLAPGAMAEPLVIELYLQPPFDSDFWFRISFGATGTPVNEISYSVPVQKVQTAYSSFFGSDRSNAAAQQMTTALLPADPLEP